MKVTFCWVSLSPTLLFMFLLELKAQLKDACVDFSSGISGAKWGGGGVLCYLHSAEHSHQFRPHPGPERGASFYHDSKHGMCKHRNAAFRLVLHRALLIFVIRYKDVEEINWTLCFLPKLSPPASQTIVRIILMTMFSFCIVPLECGASYSL